MELSSVLEILQVDIAASVTQERNFIPIPSGDICRFQFQRPKNKNKQFKGGNLSRYLKFYKWIS